MPALLWGIVSAVLLVALFALCYIHAELFYNFHKRLQDENPWLFKIVGQNEKYLDDKAKWVRHCRLYIILVGGLILAIFIPFLLIMQL